MEKENQGHLVCIIVSITLSVYVLGCLFCLEYTRSKNLIFERLRQIVFERV